MISAGFCSSAVVAEALTSSDTISSVHTSQTECGYFRLCAVCLSQSFQAALWGPWITPVVGLSVAMPPRLQRLGSGKASRRSNSYRESMLVHPVWIASPMQLLCLVFLILIFHGPTETNKRHNLNIREKQDTSIHAQILLMSTDLFLNHMDVFHFTLAFSCQGQNFRIRKSHSHCMQQKADSELFSLLRFP